MACTGVVLAGGGATRYGGLPKGLERVGGVRIIDRVAGALRDVTEDLLLIANDPSAADWLAPDVRVEGDVIRDSGSVAGIHAALTHAGGAVLVVAWDMPFVPTSLLRALRSAAETEGSGVAVPESGSRRGVEPMCAYYAPVCINAIERALARDDRRVIAFFDDVPVTRLSVEEVARFGDPEHIFMNVNTPEDLALAERIAAAAAVHDRRP
ncbi:MAG: molybdenum cofactor guanylyltransferase [Gemmatimonadaceae bacterium]